MLIGGGQQGSTDLDKEQGYVNIANLAKSVQHPANPFQSATLEFTVAGDAVTIAQVFVDSAGQEVGGTMTIRADGPDEELALAAVAELFERKFDEGA